MIQAEVHLKENCGKIRSKKFENLVDAVNSIQSGLMSFEPAGHPGIEATYVTIPVLSISYISWIEVPEKD